MKKQTKIRCGFCGDFLLKVSPHWCDLMGPPSAGMYDNQPPNSDVKELIREATRLSEEVTGIKTICAHCGYTNNSAAVEDHIKEAHSNTEATTKGGLKYDSEKPPLDLIPADPLFEIAKVLAYGAKKYTITKDDGTVVSGKNNWRKGLYITQCLAAALRHIYQSLKGELIDKESQRSHLACAACEILFALEFELNGPRFLDDRYKAEDKKEG